MPKFTMQDRLIRRWTVAAIVGCLAIAPTLTQAQQQQIDPEQMRATMTTMLETMLGVYASPETADTMATFYWNLYQALIKKGFSKEEALAITRAQNLLQGGQ